MVLVLPAMQYSAHHVSRRFNLFFVVVVVIVVFGTDAGNYLLPLLKEQSEVLIRFILCPVLAVFLDLHPAKCPRGCLPDPAQNLASDLHVLVQLRVWAGIIWKRLFFPLVTPQVLCLKRQNTWVLLLGDSCSYCPVLSPAAVAPAAI